MIAFTGDVHFELVDISQRELEGIITVGRRGEGSSPLAPTFMGLLSMAYV
jgi:hypothetical protein